MKQCRKLLIGLGLCLAGLSIMFAMPKGNAGSGIANAAGSGSPKITFFNQSYHLANYSNTNGSMWQFLTGSETDKNWKTLIMMIDYPNVTSQQELDKFSEAMMKSYASMGGKIYQSGSVQDKATDKPFKYLVLVFDEKENNRMELDFAKLAMGKNHAYIAIYAVRITDPKDRVDKAGKFLLDKTVSIGEMLAKTTFPAVETLPKK